MWAFTVKQPFKAKNYLVFHVSELELYYQSTIEGHLQPLTPVEEIKGEVHYVVEFIGRSRENKKQKRVEYLVFCKGYPPKKASWELGENFVGTGDDALRQFHKRYPKQPLDPGVNV